MQNHGNNVTIIFHRTAKVMRSWS